MSCTCSKIPSASRMCVREGGSEGGTPDVPTLARLPSNTSLSRRSFFFFFTLLSRLQNTSETSLLRKGEDRQVREAEVRLDKKQMKHVPIGDC